MVRFCATSVALCGTNVIRSSGSTIFRLQTYGFFAQRGMVYGLLRLYGLWYPFFREPTWWTKNGMGYKGIWVI